MPEEFPMAVVASGFTLACPFLWVGFRRGSAWGDYRDGLLQLTRCPRSTRGGLNHSLLSTLVSVAKHGPLRLADLAQTELVSAPSITPLVAELEAQALVSRTPDPAEGCASLIRVTDAGLEAVRVVRRVRQRVVAELLEPLAADEVASIEAALPALEPLIAPR